MNQVTTYFKCLHIHLSFRVSKAEYRAPAAFRSNKSSSVVKSGHLPTLIGKYKNPSPMTLQRRTRMES